MIKILLKEVLIEYYSYLNRFSPVERSLHLSDIAECVDAPSQQLDAVL